MTFLVYDCKHGAPNSQDGGVQRVASADHTIPSSKAISSWEQA
jgi:hypothetical protein